MRGFRVLSFRFSVLLIATAILLVVSAAALAQTQSTISAGGVSAQLGDKVVALPAPEGYEEAASQGEAARTLFATMVPREGDLLAAYLRSSDSELLKKGELKRINSWAMIIVFRPARTHVSSKAEFARIVGYARQDLEAAMSPENRNIKQMLAQVDETLSKQLSKDVKLEFSKPKVLGEFDSRPNVYSTLALMNVTLRVNAEEVLQEPVLAAGTFLLIKERVVSVNTYRRYESKADAEALTQFTTKWINEILAAN
jgi:hypothetical protein